jgi:hypothetical protein
LIVLRDGADIFVFSQKQILLFYSKTFYILLVFKLSLNSLCVDAGILWLFKIDRLIDVFK